MWRHPWTKVVVTPSCEFVGHPKVRLEWRVETFPGRLVEVDLECLRRRRKRGRGGPGPFSLTVWPTWLQTSVEDGEHETQLFRRGRDRRSRRRYSSITPMRGKEHPFTLRAYSTSYTRTYLPYLECSYSPRLWRWNRTRWGVLGTMRSEL